jgi:hypothetical protein
LLPPVFLDYYLNDSGGYDLPRLPYWAGRSAFLRFLAIESESRSRWRSI